MTGSEVVFDAWAWWEILHDTETGRRLRSKYVASDRWRVHTSAVTVHELASKLVRTGSEELVATLEAGLHLQSLVHPLTGSDARRAGRLHAELRGRRGDAGLIDALVLDLARRLGAPLISADSAFSGFPDVRTS